MLKEEDLNYIFQALAHEARRKIIKTLAEEGPMLFTELMQKVGIDETGTFGFHIKRLKELLERTEDGKYKLSELGWLAYRIIQYAEKGAAEEEIIKETEESAIKVFRNLRKILVTKEMLEKYRKVAFNLIATVLFAEDVDEKLFKEKVLFFKSIGTIVVPKPLVKLAYSRIEENCGEVIGYEGRLPEEWLEETIVKHLENYAGKLVVTRRRLEKVKREGYKLRIVNYGTLVIEEDVPHDLIDETVISIESYGPIYAPRRLHELVQEKMEEKYTEVLDISALKQGAEESISNRQCN